MPEYDEWDTSEASSWFLNADEGLYIRAEKRARELVAQVGIERGAMHMRNSFSGVLPRTITKSKVDWREVIKALADIE